MMPIQSIRGPWTFSKVILTLTQSLASPLSRARIGSPRYGTVKMKWIAILLLATPATALAEAERAFHLCSTYVQEAVVGEQTDRGWPVFVKLTDQGATSFEAFTAAHPGQMGRIVVGDRVFLRATMAASISSGRVRGTFSSRDDALAWQRTLTEQLPAAPCGPSADNARPQTSLFGTAPTPF